MGRRSDDNGRWLYHAALSHGGGWVFGAGGVTVVVQVVVVVVVWMDGGERCQGVVVVRW